VHVKGYNAETTVKLQLGDPVKEDDGNVRVILSKVSMLLGTKNSTPIELNDVVENETIENTGMDKQFVQGVLT